MMAERGLSMDHVTIWRFRVVAGSAGGQAVPSASIIRSRREDYRFIKKRTAASLWFRSVEDAGGHGAVAEERGKSARGNRPGRSLLPAIHPQKNHVRIRRRRSRSRLPVPPASGKAARTRDALSPPDCCDRQGGACRYRRQA